MKKSIKNFLSVLLLMIILALAVYSINNNLEDFKTMKIANPWVFFFLIGILLINYYLIGKVTQILLLPMGVRLKESETFMLSITTGFYNLITPFRGGMLARGVYLKKKHSFPYTDFLANLAASYVIIFLIGGFLGIASSFAIYLYSGNFNIITFSLFLAAFLSMLFIVVFSPKFKETKWRFVNNFIRVANGWNLIKGNKKIVIMVSLISLIQVVMSSLSLFLQFYFFGLEIGFFECIFLVTISTLGILISITPAGLGIQEAIIVFSAMSIGINTTESLSVAILGRLVSFIALFVLGPIFSGVLLKKR